MQQLLARVRVQYRCPASKYSLQILALYGRTERPTPCGRASLEPNRYRTCRYVERTVASASAAGGRGATRSRENTQLHERRGLRHRNRTHHGHREELEQETASDRDRGSHRVLAHRSHVRIHLGRTRAEDGSSAPLPGLTAGARMLALPGRPLAAAEGGREPLVPPPPTSATPPLRLHRRSHPRHSTRPPPLGSLKVA